jgi:uncharacterized protein (DUF697 family)
MHIPESAATVNDSLLAICLFAAFADGEKSDAEREAIRQIAADLGSDKIASLSRQILLRKLPFESVVAGLTTNEERLLAYEMALGICEAGGSISRDEQEFLTHLKTQLNLGDSADTVEKQVAAVAMESASTATLSAPTPPPLPGEALVPAPAPDNSLPPASPDNSAMILRYSILNGALELLPETLATMAIVPLQMKMVYRIGKSHGVELDRSSLKEFLAVAGAGLGSQMVEGFARKLMRGFSKKIAGRMVGRAADQFTGSAFSFAATYAIGYLAEEYYGGGRRLDAGKLKQHFATLQGKAKELHSTYLPQIRDRARNLDASSIMSLVTGGGNV